MIESYIRDVPDYPKSGIVYKDIQPLLADRDAFNKAVRNMLFKVKSIPDYFIGIESRGFIFASAMAIQSGSGLKLIRKQGKLPPGNLITVTYDTEYSTDTLQIDKVLNSNDHKTAIIVDDVFATGGTMEAAKELTLKAGYALIGTVCLVDIGINKNHDTKCLISY